MKIWKLSLGKNEFNDQNFDKLIKNKLVSVYPTTKAKGQSNKTQGENFIEAEKGDLFYVCRSNDTVELIGMFKDNFPLIALDNNYGKDGWVDREFILICEAKNKMLYDKSLDKWWSPKNNSTFIEISKHDFKLFEEKILLPVFEITLDKLKVLSNKEKSMYSLDIQKLQNMQKYFQNIKMKKETLFEEINNISIVDKKKLLYIFNKIDNIEQNPVVFLRKTLIENSLEKLINQDIVDTLKKELTKNYQKDVYIRWSYFSIFYPLLYFKEKEKVISYLERFIKLIIKKLQLQQFVSSTKPFHFDGANNFGKETIWFAIYNNTYEKQIHAYQLFFSIENGLFKYGLFHMDNKKENKIVEKEKLCFKELIETLTKYINIIKNDNSKEKAMITDKVDLLEFKKQIILQGPPGTGKTRLAKQIARFMIKNEMEPIIDDIKEQVKIVQFHPSYSYEDFVRGIVAKSNGTHIEYITEDKLLINMSNKAISNPDNKYILIIDEINRANLSSVLGELIYGLEYRGEAVESMYADTNGNREIKLPKNLYIIGTMNTADRSIGHIDYAIRRRFAFTNILSNDNNVLSAFPNGEVIYNETVKLFTDTYISPEFNIDDIKIGHSYFIVENDSKDELQNKLEFEIKPLLMEYVKDGILNENSIKIINELSVGNNN